MHSFVQSWLKITQCFILLIELLLVLLVVVRTQHLWWFLRIVDATLFAARHGDGAYSILFWAFNDHFHLSGTHRWCHLIRSSIIWLVITYIGIRKVLSFITTIKNSGLIHKTSIKRILLDTIGHHYITLICALLRYLRIAAAY